MSGAAVEREAAERRAARDAFLVTPRAQTLCARELDRLVAAVADGAGALAAELGATVEVRRMPGRCIVQLGPVALTVSWIRGRAESVASGCLLVGDWEGIVARGAERVPERSNVPVTGRTAKLVREIELVADATGDADWRWRRRDAEQTSYASGELADRSLEALAAGWRARMA